ncbi:YigZ family protein [Spiroplasma gladiatoris]|uniref:YigZ family protein n=1 Tax=Spiroplasma gladiatoris TaxID=2143 RepID=A0A4P7AHW9_9MOLU|nr:YigZ family protein [Spiroplasma gladiatoris]QBQ07278.1 YigZ family protein [Spiroplasma gladiatoris]
MTIQKILLENKIFIFEKTIKKSKFITYIAKIHNENELEEFIKKYKQSNATHNCWAFQFGINNNIRFGYNNDGEPNGTAGEPLLNLIKVNNLTNIVIFCIRFYGGIKLGVGGLQKAYSIGAINLLKYIKTKVLELLYLVKIKFNISDIKKINLYLNNLLIKDLKKLFKENEVIYTFKIDKIDDLKVLNMYCSIDILKQDYF